MSYTEFDVPESLEEKTYEAIEKARDTGKIRIGTNETTKSIERDNTDIVVIAGDVEPAEIVMHIPALCGEKDITYTFVGSKEELGMAAGINVQTATVAISDSGSAKDDVEEIIEKIKELKE